MKRYRVRYFDGDSRLLDAIIWADSEVDAMSQVRSREGSHIGIQDAKEFN